MPTFRTYVLRIIEPDPAEDTLASIEDTERSEVSAILAGRIFNHVEDIINDALPDGWQAKVSEWDS